MKDNEAPSEAARSALVCPECAAPASLREVRPPWPVRRRRLVQIAVFLIALGYVVWRNIEAWPVMPVPFTYWRTGAGFPPHQYTHADIKQYASGEVSNGQLIGDLYNTHMLGNFELDVAFIPPAGTVTEGLWYGWPTGFIVWNYTARYDDVYARTNAFMGPSGTYSYWQGLNYYAQRINAQGRRENYFFLSKGLAGPSLMLIVAWSVGRVMRWLLIAVRLARRNGHRKRDRLARGAPFICIVACAIGVAAASRRQSASDFIIPASPNTPCTKTGLTIADLAQLRSLPTGDAVLARAILDAAGDETPDPNASLVFGWFSAVEVTFTTGEGGWPESSIYRTVEQVERYANGARSPPQITFGYNATSFRMFVRSGEPLERMDFYQVSTINAVTLMLGLCAVWITTGLGVWLVGWTVRRRTARRLTHGRCVQCGYDLKGLRGNGEDLTHA